MPQRSFTPTTINTLFYNIQDASCPVYKQQYCGQMSHKYMWGLTVCFHVIHHPLRFKDVSIQTSPKWLMAYIYQAACMLEKRTNFSSLLPSKCCKKYKIFFFTLQSLGFHSMASLHWHFSYHSHIRTCARTHQLVLALSSRLFPFVVLVESYVCQVSNLSKGQPKMLTRLLFPRVQLHLFTSGCWYYK